MTEAPGVVGDAVAPPALGPLGGTGAVDQPRVEPMAWPVIVFAAVLVWAVAGLSAEGAVHAVLVGVLVAAASIDLRHRVLPNRIVLPAIPVVLAGHAVVDPGSLLEHVVAMAGTGAGLWLLAVLSRGGLGMGDVKTAALMGAGLGTLVLSGLFIGTLASAVVGLVLIARNGAGARRTAIPLGPFLAFGTTVVVIAEALA